MKSKVQCLIAPMLSAAIVGDITPNDGVSKEEKARLEANAICEIQTMLGANTSAGIHTTTLGLLNF